MARLSRRNVFRFALATGASTQLAALPSGAKADASASLIEPVPLPKVRLLPSIFKTALEANQKYLLSLDADRFLHNFRLFAGLVPKAPAYGGWEERGIAGHSLGHYQSACALMWQQTGIEEFKRRVEYISSELATVQAVYKDGYAGGTFVERDGKKLNGKAIFEELKRGEISSNGFDLNGGWVPIYTYHKVLAGAINGFLLCDHALSMHVAIGLADYLASVLSAVSDDKLQLILGAEHGGINESFAQLYSITGNKTYIEMAKRIRHKAIINDIAIGKDILDGKHANTQIPKFIGLARIYEATQDANYARTALLFWDMVVKDHSYVIGGNSNHEHFGPPRKLSNQLDQQTCEACNTYNMLKLTRHLYSWTKDANYFDFFERAHLNHIMSQIRPSDGAFSYFTPLAPGASRVYSHPTNDFWCCVGSGMESHSKHGDSIYWHQNDALIINLFYPSRIKWPEKSLELSMTGDFPNSDTLEIEIIEIANNRGGIRKIFFRKPKWCKSPELYLNDEKVEIIHDGQYLKFAEVLRRGDKIKLKLTMDFYTESMPDKENLLSILYGPTVLAADLGDEKKIWDIGDPVIIGGDALAGFKKSPTGFQFDNPQRTFPANLSFAPFYIMHGKKTGVYFVNLSKDEWAQKSESVLIAAKKKAAIEAATSDFVRIGEMQSERDHSLDATPNTVAVTHIGLRGRLLNKGYISFFLEGEKGPKELRVSYAGRDKNKSFKLVCNERLVFEEKLSGTIENGFNIIVYNLGPEFDAISGPIKFSFIMENDQWASVYEARLLLSSNSIYSQK